MGIYDFTFYDVINRNARIFAESPAWSEVDDGRSLTFAEYKAAVDRIARGLRQAGFKKGDRIGVLGKNSLEYFLLYGAAAAMGGILLPINWRLAAEEVCFNLNDCRPAVIFVDREYQALIEENRSKLSGVDHFYNLKADEGGFTSFNGLYRDDAVEPADLAGVSDGYVIIHTAAVAGRPRGALLSHRNLISANMHLMYLFNIRPQEVHLNLLPLFHIAGLVMVTGTFHAGGQSVNVSRFDAGRAAELIESRRAALMFDFSPILASILDAAAAGGKDLSSLRAVLGLDTPETIEKYQQQTGGTFYCMYGQTETSCLATLGRFNDRPGSAGRTIEMADVRLVDDADRPVAPGEIGEIAVKGPMVFEGYWNLPEDNARTFRGGWHHTGDLGRFDTDGYLWYEGRKAEKELIKPGGENVYPAEVEKVILQHPAVETTVVFGVPDPRWKEGIKAVCRLKPGKKLTESELIEFVGSCIARYKKPQHVEFVEEMPTLENGDPDREEVKKRFGGPQG